MNMTKLAILT